MGIGVARQVRFRMVSIAAARLKLGPP